MIEGMQHDVKNISMDYGLVRCDQQLGVAQAGGNRQSEE